MMTLREFIGCLSREEPGARLLYLRDVPVAKFVWDHQNELDELTLKTGTVGNSVRALHVDDLLVMLQSLPSNLSSVKLRVETQRGLSDWLDENDLMFPRRVA